MLKDYTCIICPVGCYISVTIEDGTLVNIEGNNCTKGYEYVKQELTHPMRNIASSVMIRNGELPLTSVRLTKAIPKTCIFKVMEEIRHLVLNAPVRIGQIALKNIADTDSDLIVTKNVDYHK